MATVFEKIPPLMAIAFQNEDDLRIYSVEDNLLKLESGKELEEKLSLMVCLFNGNSDEYDEFVFDRSSVVLSEKKDFSYIYNARLDCSDPSVMRAYISGLAALYDLINEMNEHFTIGHNFTKKDFYQTFGEQEREWYDLPLPEEHDIKFREMVQPVELAYAIDNGKLYSQFLELPFTEAIDNNLKRRELKKHGIFSKPFDRVYVGNEFCPYLFPDDEILSAIIEKAFKEGYKITVVFPYTREDMIEKCHKTLCLLDDISKKKGEKLEVIVNDWGIIDFIKNSRFNLVPVLGRLLNKRKKDPRIKEKRKLEKYYNQLSGNNLNSKHFAKFLKDMGITRYEFETHGIMNEIPEGNHSIHFPFYQMNTGQYCIMYAECKNMNRWKQEFVRACPQYCTEFCFTYPKSLNMIGRGNSNFGFEKSVLKNPEILGSYIGNGIDRLVLDEIF